MNKKKKFTILILLLMVGISIGYALLNVKLDITGKTSIGKSTWDVHFENVQITDGSVEATKAPAIENYTTVDFEVGLNLPGDFYEFTVDVVNEGSIDAMIDSVLKTPDLTETQQKYLNYIIEYQNGEQITTKQLVKSEEFVRLKVRVEFKKDISASDLPQTKEILILGFNVNYAQSDGTGVEVSGNGITYVDGDINEIGTVVTIGTEKFYTIGIEGDNVKLLSMYNLHVGSEIKNINFETQEIDMSEISNPTGMQSSKAKGAMVEIDGENVNYLFPWIGVTAFASEEKHGEEYSSYEGSIVEGYVDTYASLLEDKYAVEIEEARLITKEELTDSETFKCSEEKNSCLESPYPWIYSTTYWSGSACGTNDVWDVGSNGNFGNDSYDNGNGGGVRPVIVISKSVF